MQDVKINVQGVKVVTDLHVIIIVGLDVVLGSAWLKSVRRVLTDYGSMIMKFKLDGKKRI